MAYLDNKSIEEKIKYYEMLIGNIEPALEGYKKTLQSLLKRKKENDRRNPKRQK